MGTKNRWAVRNLRVNRFIKVNVLIMVLLVPILILYAYSYRTNVNVLQEKVQSFHEGQLMFLHHQLEKNVDQLDMMSNVMIKDPSIKDLRDLDLYGDYIDVLHLKQTISEKLNLQSVANTFSNTITVYSPPTEQAVGQYSYVAYDRKELLKAHPDWKLADNEFVKYAFDPIHAENLADKAGLIIKVGFSTDNLVKMLDAFQAANNGETLFYKANHPPILQPGTDRHAAARLIENVEPILSGERGQTTIRLGSEDFMVHYLYFQPLDGYFVDYVSIREFVTPIVNVRNVFYLFIALLMVIGFMSSYLLYSNFQKPIRELTRGVQRLTRGDYTTRIKLNPSDEFSFLFQRFNEMTEEIENLIKKVYTEQIRSKDATLKQLQSQINPHFLYNCLAFIKSMAILDQKKSIVAMTDNLSRYYRYTTRNEKQTVPLREELQLIKSYLSIQHMQMHQLTYSVDIPSAIMELQIPRLLLQPVVENAVVHGLEPQLEGGRVELTSEMIGNRIRIYIDDSGTGLSDDQQRKLETQINLPLAEQAGCGLWNVHQRLTLHFGPGSGLSFSPSPLGGLRVTLQMTVLSDAYSLSPIASERET